MNNPQWLFAYFFLALDVPLALADTLSLGIQLALFKITTKSFINHSLNHRIHHTLFWDQVQIVYYGRYNNSNYRFGPFGQPPTFITFDNVESQRHWHDAHPILLLKELPKVPLMLDYAFRAFGLEPVATCAEPLATQTPWGLNVERSTDGFRITFGQLCVFKWDWNTN